MKLERYLFILALALRRLEASFVSTGQAFRRSSSACNPTKYSRVGLATRRPSQLHLMAPEQMQTILIATIDSDISKMSDNEFAPVFLGGILVMLGGLLSAVFVGLIVDKKDLYSQIVADSYLQGSDDEAFWKGLSEEEKRKTQEMLANLKSKKNPSVPTSTSMASPVALEASLDSTPSKPEKSSSPSATKPTVVMEKAIGMFSDYGDEA